MRSLVRGAVTPRTVPQSRPTGSTISNDNPERRGVFDGFGHYEDDPVKIDGQWLFTKRKIYNEGRDEWSYRAPGILPGRAALHNKS
jgi:hypothetical protein